MLISSAVMAILTFVPLSFVLIAPLIYVVVTRYQIYQKLSGFKGPFLASISDLWLLKQSLKHRQHHALEEVLDRYGSYARIAPNMVVTNDPDLLRYMSAPRSPWRRAGWYEIHKFDATTDNIFSTTDEKKHTLLRSKLGPAYSGKGVDNLESSIEDQINIMLNMLRRDHTNSGRVVDMSRLSQYFTLDVLSAIAFGRAFGYLEANEDLWNYISITQKFIPMFELASDFPWLQKHLFGNPIIAKLMAPKDEDKVGQGKIAEIAHKMIGERYALAADEAEKGRNQKADMLGHFISHNLSQKEAESEAHLQILAGSESTSTAFNMTMLYIVTNPRVYKALQAEIDTAVASGRISPDSVIKDSEARQLPYLQAVIWEGLRMCPPLFGLMSKIAPPGGDTFKGVFFPAGTEVVASPSSVTHRKDLIGEDAHLFRPERWLEADEATHARYMSTVDLVFGSGRFGCLGKNIGMLELNKVFVELLRHFDWTIEDSVRPVQERFGAGIWIQNGMNMIVTERKK
ncbi:cytochrome p450 protein [Rutstroemia sp. NJR-2017a BVV2]|nr:cytochrome p450 protein [Rutstroemia sp. NJR-2017a BVV2]